MSSDTVPSPAKKILFINNRAPYGSSLAKESLDAVLAASVFGQDISVLFLGDGVFQLKNGQDTTALAFKNLASTFPVLPLYEIEKIFVQRSALEVRGLSIDDLVLPAQCINEKEIAQLIENQDTLLSF